MDWVGIVKFAVAVGIGSGLLYWIVRSAVRDAMKDSH